ncbi:forkhead box protein D5 [Scomber scombrus]|uniref:Forkhead box protein D5 n=1 Tax=Scomber scombrus TaxID=13677 RepID=A0AAV1MUT8_SCOSC
MTLSSEFEASQHAALPLEEDEIDIVGEDESTRGYRNDCSTDPGSSAESGAEFDSSEPDSSGESENSFCADALPSRKAQSSSVSPPPAAPIRYMPLQEGIMMPPSSYHLLPQTLNSHGKCSGPKDFRAQLCTTEPADPKPGPQAKCSFSIESIMSKPSLTSPQNPNLQQSPHSALGYAHLMSGPAACLVPTLLQTPRTPFCPPAMLSTAPLINEHLRLSYPRC